MSFFYLILYVKATFQLVFGLFQNWPKEPVSVEKRNKVISKCNIIIIHKLDKGKSVAFFKTTQE